MVSSVVITMINVLCLILGIVDMFVVDIPWVHSSVAQLVTGAIGTLVGCVLIYLNGDRD